MSERDSNPAAGAVADKRRLAAAFALSSLLHAAALTAGAGPGRPQHEVPPPAMLQATLVPAPQAPIPLLRAPEPVEAAGSPAKPPPARPRTVPPKKAGMQADLATLASRQIARRLLYPEEAIARGLEGQATVMLFLDARGNAVAARLERSSGHAILDEAAVAAARQVSALPEGEPREVLLPVRFRLR